MTAGKPLGRQDDPAVMREHINETRQRISNDLDELGEKLNPQNVKAQIKDGVREATIGRVEDMARNAGDGFMQTIRDNPIPAAITGMGLAWLFMNRSSSTSPRMGGASRYADEAGRSGYRDTADTYRPYSGESYRYETQQSRFAEVADSVKERVGGVAEKAEELVSSASGTSSQQARRVQDTFFENPLAIAAAAVAAGLAVGLVTPETSTERRLMGDVSGEVRDKVTEVARETGDKVSAVAERVVEETKNAAREEGLTGTGTQSNPYL